jgi:putative hydrolase of the HAD superfamily
VSEIGLVCFDLGGVILHVCRSWAEGCAAAGIEVRAAVDSFEPFSSGADELHAAHQRGEIDLDTYAASLSRLTDGLYRPEEVVRIHDAWIYGEYPGVDGVVTRIHAAGLETAVLSNTTPEHWMMMPRFPTVQKLRNRFGSHELAVRKPDAAAYRAIERHTGFSGGQVLFFDDLEPNVQAARTMAWHGRPVDPLGAPAEQIGNTLTRYGIA